MQPITPGEILFAICLVAGVTFLLIGIGLAFVRWSDRRYGERFGCDFEEKRDRNDGNHSRKGTSETGFVSKTPKSSHKATLREKEKEKKS